MEYHFFLGLTLFLFYNVLLNMTTTCLAKTYYVTPSDGVRCPSEQASCFPLNQYATKPTRHYDSNTTLILLPGKHFLDSSLVITSIANIDIVSPHNDMDVISVVTYSSDDNSTVTYLYGSDEDIFTATVVCSEAANFMFEHVNRVRISGVRFIGCTNNALVNINYCYLESCHFEGLGHNGTAIIFNAVSVVYVVQSTFNSYSGIEMQDPFYARRSMVGGAMVAANCTVSNDYHDHVTVNNCTFYNNTVSSLVHGYSGAMHVDSCDVNVYNSLFSKNTVNAGDEGKGGAIFAVDSSVYLADNVFDENTVNAIKLGNGGALFIHWYSDITMRGNIFSSNVVRNAQNIGNGGAVYAMLCSNIVMYRNSFLRNAIHSSTAGEGGAMYADSRTVAMRNNVFSYNTVNVSDGAYGGALDVHFCDEITLTNTTFTGNSVSGSRAYGGALYYYSGLSLSINGSLFVGNKVTGVEFAFGAGMYLDNVNQYSPCQIMHLTFKENIVYSKSESMYRASGVFCTLRTNLTSSGFIRFQDNNGISAVAYAEQSCLLLSGITTIENNTGSIYAFDSNVTFLGYTSIMYNVLNTFDLGAVTGFQSQFYFYDTVNIAHNTAVRGGGLSLIESKVFTYRNVTITYCYASVSGGGVYSYQSEIYALGQNGILTISDNFAVTKGGGIHAISSAVKIFEGSILLSKNYAKKGGGICLELNSKLYIIKSEAERPSNNKIWRRLELAYNTADLGGALFVTDETNSGTCAAQAIPTTTMTSNSNALTASTDNECFLQTLVAYEINFVCYSEWKSLNFINYFFRGNTAITAGSTLYGGLLDRCSASQFSNVFRAPDEDSIVYNSTQTLSYVVNITDIQFQDFKSPEVISSAPVRVCFCISNQKDCNYHPAPRNVKKGESFVVSLVAVDQVNNTVPNVTIHGSVSLEGRLATGQSIQNTNRNGSCTNLKYNVYSTRKVEQLKLYAEGPCTDIGISATFICVLISPCPIGFRDVNQECVCDPYLYPTYVSDCSIDTNSVQRTQNVWISFVNDTKHRGYVTHKHCPFDYCLPSTVNVSINLGDFNGSDALCAFNRSGKLCGACKDGLSLTLGSSQCKLCSNNWLALLIAFSTAGIALVVFILVCNLTVAIGTLNGLILYANIVAANSAVFLPFDKPNVVTVFIAWFNLDFGFETCFFDGMDSYAKVWLQIAFPLYILLLVVMVIYLSELSRRFARLLLDKNPVAALSTLILLSYTKFIRIIIAAFSVTTLEYSDGSHDIVWLYDSNIHYFEWKHILLFIVALVVFCLGLVYTLLLLFWPWLYSHSNRKMLKWVSNPRLFYFMDAYQAPYHPRHRYWTGLLLLARVMLYLISALNVIGDPNINLVAIVCVVVGLQFLSKVVKTVYKQWPLDVLESSYILNLTIFAAGTLYVRHSGGNQVALAYCSTSIAIVTFVMIIVYHCINYVLKNALLKLKKFISNPVLHLADCPTNELIATNTKNDVDILVESGSVTEFDGNPLMLDTDAYGGSNKMREQTSDDNSTISVSMSQQVSDSDLQPQSFQTNCTKSNSSDTSDYCNSHIGIQFEDSNVSEGFKGQETTAEIELKKMSSPVTQLTELMSVCDDMVSLKDESSPLLESM